MFKLIHVQYTRTESDRLGYATVRLTGSPIARDLEKYTEVFTEGVKCWRIDSIGHGRTRPVSLCVGSTEQSPIARDLEKYIEVFTEGVKCWRIDSIGHGRTRPVSLWVGSTERKSDRERLSKIPLGVYRGCKMLADRLHRTRTDTARLSFCRFDWAKSDRERLRKIH